jgi:ElaA protein
MKLEWTLKPFAELSVFELYEILQLRMEVFVVEQNCVFQDCDDKDQPSFHLMGLYDNKLVASTRLVPPGIMYEEPSIGRVVTSPAFRNMKFGRELMTRSIETCYSLFGKQTISIGAQVYLKKFYGSFGFVQTGETYMEDGIEHIHMLLV